MTQYRARRYSAHGWAACVNRPMMARCWLPLPHLPSLCRCRPSAGRL